MSTQLIIYSALLGLAAGAASFLPVSATGHVIFLEEALHFGGPPGKLFETSLPLGAVIAICWFYRARLQHLATCLHQKPQQRLAFNLAIAWLPVLVFGAMFHALITGSLFHMWVVGAMLLIGGVAILGVEKWKPPITITTLEDITPMHAFVIGMYQVLALIPGVSLLATGILGGMTLGIEREAATEFSLLLSIPTLLAAAMFNLWMGRHGISTEAVMLITIGVAASSFSALLVVRWCVGYISNHPLYPFGGYRILIGGAILAALLLR